MLIFSEDGVARQHSDHIARGVLINWSATTGLGREEHQALQGVLRRTLVRESLLFRPGLNQSRTEIEMTRGSSKLD